MEKCGIGHGRPPGVMRSWSAWGKHGLGPLRIPEASSQNEKMPHCLAAGLFRRRLKGSGRPVVGPSILDDPEMTCDFGVVGEEAAETDCLIAGRGVGQAKDHETPESLGCSGEGRRSPGRK